MTTLRHKWLTPGRATRLATIAAFLAACSLGYAQETSSPAASTKTVGEEPKPASTTPIAEFQYSAITGSGSTLLATRVPAVNSSGKTLYWDVTLLFDVDSNGNLTLDPEYPQIVASPNFITAGFLPGNYQGPSNVNGGNNLITVSGPGVGPGGTTQWSLFASAGASANTYPDAVSWYVGPYTTNPLQSRLKAAGISTSDYPNYSWGSGDSGSDPGLHWETNTLMAFSQVGKTLTILSFSTNSKDYNTVQDTIVYTCISGACAAH